MSQVTNPCKFCFKQVNYKNGLRCSGTCMEWAHFKCLNYSQEAFKDTRSGKLKPSSPCPDCLKHLNPVTTIQTGSSDTPSFTDQSQLAAHQINVLTKRPSHYSEEPTSTRCITIPQTLSSYHNEIQVSNCCHHSSHHSSHRHRTRYRNDPVIRTYVRDQSTQDGERYSMARREKRQGTPCECRPKKNLNRNHTIKYVPLPIEYNRDYEDYDDYMDRRVRERSRRSDHHRHRPTVRVASPVSSSEASREGSSESQASIQSNRTMILALQEMYNKVKVLSQKIHSLVDKPGNAEAGTR